MRNLSCHEVVELVLPDMFPIHVEDLKGTIMRNRPFFSIAPSPLTYARLDGSFAKPHTVALPSRVRLLLEDSLETPYPLKAGDSVATGQKIAPRQDGGNYVISSVTGTISAVAPFMGDYGQNYIEISIETNAEETIDQQFMDLAQNPTLQVAQDFLVGTPGNPPLKSLSQDKAPIHTLVICGVDPDLLLCTNQYMVQSNLDAINKGIKIIKAITRVESIIMALSRDTLQGIGHLEAELKAVEPYHPAGLPRLIMKDVLGQIVPAGKSCEDLGVVFMRAEAVASLGTAFDARQIPVTKIFTLITKEGARTLVAARIGTPLRAVFKTFDITLNEHDRIILGGPMTGKALYSEDFPIRPDTDAVMIQDHQDIPYVSDYPCINCGECVRACPARMPVNMLIRLLEAGHYEEAVESYDLDSCLQCGLCSFVCVSKIPIFQYIRLAKYELARTRLPEAAHE